MVVAVVGVVVAAAAVLSPAAAGGLGREGTCRCRTAAPRRIVFHSSSAPCFFTRPGRSDQRRLRSCAHKLSAAEYNSFGVLWSSSGLQRRRCRIRAKFSATGTLSPATRAAGTWSPAMGATFRSCMLLL